ncbi:tRNA:m4X modification enzyme, partial [Cladochytrium tenue]
MTPGPLPSLETPSPPPLEPTKEDADRPRPSDAAVFIAVMPPQPPPFPPPRPGICAHWLPRKRRYCPMLLAANSDRPYCPAHAAEHATEHTNSASAAVAAPDIAADASTAATAAVTPATPPPQKFRRSRSCYRPCPYDPRRCHGSANPTRHARTCNFRPRFATASSGAATLDTMLDLPPPPPYLRRGANARHAAAAVGPTDDCQTASGEAVGEEMACETTAVATAATAVAAAGPDRVRRVVAAVWAAWGRVFGAHVEPDDAWPERMLDHPALAKNAAPTGKRGKHAHQQSSLVAHLAALGLLARNMAYVELGCGAGELSGAIRTAALATAASSSPTATAEASAPRFVLVDRAASRTRVAATTAPAGTFVKLRVDVADLVLAGVPELRTPLPAAPHIAAADDAASTTDCSPPGGVVAVSKHLCGAATDLALRCLAAYAAEHAASAAEAQPPPLLGVVLAPCCHHRCRREDYVDPGFLIDFCGLGWDDLPLVFAMTSWAVSGSRPAPVAGYKAAKASAAAVTDPVDAA